MLKLLKDLDQFGVVFQPRIKYTTDQYKTYWGGIMSILLYGLSLTYLIYLFVQWRTGQILPKISSQQIVQEDYKLELNETYLELQLRKYQYTQIDPFNPNAIILQPVLYYFTNGMPSKGQQVNYTLQSTNSGYYTISVQNLSISISQQQNDENPEIEYLIGFGDCIPYFLKDGQQCANSSTVTAFFAQPTNTIVARQFVKEFNTNTQQLETIPRESLIPVQKTLTYQAQNSVQIAQTYVDVGFLFESLDYYSYITDFRTTSAALDIDYYLKIMTYSIFVSFLYEVDNIQVEQTIAYSKISEILADAGSIASTLLVLSYLIVMLNSSQLQYEAINNVISMYYPDFKDIKITKNIFGKIHKVERHGKQVDLNQFQQMYERLSQIGEVKLTISNQIYEISRLQFLLQSIINKKNIQQIHQKGLPLSINFAETPKEEQQSINISMNQEYQFKQNTIVNNFSIQLPNNQTSADMPTLQPTESKLNVHPKEQPPPIQEIQLTDRDFELLLLPNEDAEKNKQNLKSDNNIQIQK